jgi:hypothetical protein
MGAPQLKFSCGRIEHMPRIQLSVLSVFEPISCDAGSKIVGEVLKNDVSPLLKTMVLERYVLQNPVMFPLFEWA